jgi:hypothetical protein
VLKAVVKVILNQGLLGLCDGFFDGVQLLHHLQARLSLFEHLDNAAQVAARAAQPLDHGWMGFVRVHME